MTDFEYENAIFKQGFKYICGVDEAGRGPWAGPVVAAAVILDPKNIPVGLNDSKKLSAKKREELAIIIKQVAIDYSVHFIDAAIIDKVNILEATYLAMNGSINSLKHTEYALIDGNRSPKPKIPCQTIIKGDSKSASIAAASILAKTARDEFMSAAHYEYPQYDFINNMGYGVAKHAKALEEFGTCIYHRKSFKPIKAIENSKEL